VRLRLDPPGCVGCPVVVGVAPFDAGHEVAACGHRADRRPADDPVAALLARGRGVGQEVAHACDERIHGVLHRLRARFVLGRLQTQALAATRERGRPDPGRSACRCHIRPTAPALLLPLPPVRGSMRCLPGPGAQTSSNVSRGTHRAPARRVVDRLLQRSYPVGCGVDDLDPTGPGGLFPGAGDRLDPHLTGSLEGCRERLVVAACETAGDLQPGRSLVRSRLER
jgi:hypothetical protein